MPRGNRSAPPVFGCCPARGMYRRYRSRCTRHASASRAPAPREREQESPPALARFNLDGQGDGHAGS
eukprot:scaffold1821_cov344-Pavlova_lutheri.AAC.29